MTKKPENEKRCFALYRSYVISYNPQGWTESEVAELKKQGYQLPSEFWKMQWPDDWQAVQRYLKDWCEV